MRDTGERQSRKSGGRRSREDAKPRRQRIGSVGRVQVMGREKSSHQNPFLRRHTCVIWRNIFNLFCLFLTISEHLWLGQISFSFEKRKI